MTTTFMSAPTLHLTSESVTEGHPDKMCDQISDAVLDAILREDPMGRVACETGVTTGLVVVMGLAFNSTIVPAMTESVLADAETSDGLTRGVAQGLLGIIGSFGTAFLLAGGIPTSIGLLMALVASTLRPPAPTIGGGLSGRSGVITAE